MKNSFSINMDVLSSISSNLLFINVSLSESIPL